MNLLIINSQKSVGMRWEQMIIMVSSSITLNVNTKSVNCDLSHWWHVCFYVICFSFPVSSDDVDSFSNV